jgi:hypothetical protein
MHGWSDIAVKFMGLPGFLKEYSPQSSQRGRAATETRNISRKDAKAAKVGKNGEKNSQEYLSFRSTLGAFAPWREEFPNPRIFGVFLNTESVTTRVGRRIFCKVSVK